MVTVRNVLGRWGRKAAEATKKAENLAGNTWQHCEFSLLIIILYIYLFCRCYVFLILKWVHME